MSLPQEPLKLESRLNAYALARGIYPSIYQSTCVAQDKDKDNPLFKSAALIGRKMFTWSDDAVLQRRDEVLARFVEANNFAILALDQIINNAAKLRYMSGGQLKVPMVIRGPGGAAHQLSSQPPQAIESFFVHTPGLNGQMPPVPAPAQGLPDAGDHLAEFVLFRLPGGEYRIWNRNEGGSEACGTF